MIKIIEVPGTYPFLQQWRDVAEHERRQQGDDCVTRGENLNSDIHNHPEGVIEEREDGRDNGRQKGSCDRKAQILVKESLKAVQLSQPRYGSSQELFFEEFALWLVGNVGEGVFCGDLRCGYWTEQRVAFTMKTRRRRGDSSCVRATVTKLRETPDDVVVGVADMTYGAVIEAHSKADHREIHNGFKDISSPNESRFEEDPRHVVLKNNDVTRREHHHRQRH